MTFFVCVTEYPIRGVLYCALQSHQRGLCYIPHLVSVQLLLFQVRDLVLKVKWMGGEERQFNCSRHGQGLWTMWIYAAFRV